MLFKYWGETCIEENGKCKQSLRTSCFEDGLFRFTQPSYLNDRLEAKPKMHSGQYGDRFYEVHDPQGLRSRGQVEFDEQIIPKDINPHCYESQGFSTQEELFEARFIQTVDKIIADIDKTIGILSLATSHDNHAMWTHYATEHTGVCVGFDKKVAQIGASSRRVDYDKQLVSFELSYEGNDIYIDGNHENKFSNIDNLPLTSSDFDRFVFHKSEVWSYEDEFRVWSYLKDCQPSTDTVFLKKIPFSFFSSIYLGYKMANENKELILEKVRSNKDLSHVKIFQQKHSNVNGVTYSQID